MADFSQSYFRDEDYSTESIVQDLIQLLEHYPSRKSLVVSCSTSLWIETSLGFQDTQSVYFQLVGHSYGSRVAVKLTHSLKSRQDGVEALVLLAPKARASSEEADVIRKVTSTPLFILDLMRLLDR